MLITLPHSKAVKISLGRKLQILCFLSLFYPFSSKATFINLALDPLTKEMVFFFLSLQYLSAILSECFYQNHIFNTETWSVFFSPQLKHIHDFCFVFFFRKTSQHFNFFIMLFTSTSRAPFPSSPLTHNEYVPNIAVPQSSVQTQTSLSLLMIHPLSENTLTTFFIWLTSAYTVKFISFFLI